jgi:hypothetical protein
LCLSHVLRCWRNERACYPVHSTWVLVAQRRRLQLLCLVCCQIIDCDVRIGVTLVFNKSKMTKCAVALIVACCVLLVQQHVLWEDRCGAHRPRQRSGPALLSIVFFIFCPFFSPTCNHEMRHKSNGDNGRQNTRACTQTDIVSSTSNATTVYTVSQYNPECCTNIVKFASCIEMPSGFDSASIICLPGLFALDVCASIHLYASNASAPLHNVLFSAIVVETIVERVVSVK